MAMITYPLDNIDYSAADAGLFHCTRKSGVWAEDSFPISASGSDNSITIGSGVAWISNDKYWGKVVAQKEAVALDLGLADPVYNRIDAVVIQFDSNANVTDIVVKKGTPATNPSMPGIVQNESIFELCLCKVLRPAGSSVVTFTNIADTRLDPTICGLMADSVTKIDTKAINAQVQALILSLTEEIESVKDKSGLMHTSDWVEDGVFSIAKGGTGATTADAALTNLGAAPKDHASTGTTYGMATSVNYGHVKLSGSVSNTSGKDGGVAATPSAVREAYNRGTTGITEAKKKIEKIKLWENASPGSTLTQQTLSINLNDYDFIEVVCNYASGYPNRLLASAICPVKAGSQAAIYNDTNYRTITVDSLTAVSLNNANGNANGNVIPVYIFGIKGVQ